MTCDRITHDTSVSDIPVYRTDPFGPSRPHPRPPASLSPGDGAKSGNHLSVGWGPVSPLSGRWMWLYPTGPCRTTGTHPHRRGSGRGKGGVVRFTVGVGTRTLVPLLDRGKWNRISKVPCVFKLTILPPFRVPFGHVRQV